MKNSQSVDLEPNDSKQFVLPADTYHGFCVFAFQSKYFDLSIVLKRLSWYGHELPSIPTPFQLEAALDEWENSGVVDKLQCLNVVYFDPFTGHADLVVKDSRRFSVFGSSSAEYLRVKQDFKKSYCNFYYNFNPKNYIYS